MSEEQLSDESVNAETNLENKPEEELPPAPETLPAKDVELVNAYSMRPAFGEVFPLPAIKGLISNIINQKLKGKTYNATDVAKWVTEISDEINVRIKEIASINRFKHVVQVYIAQQLGAGCHYIARCCWDADSDTHVTDVFQSPTLFCVCTVFGVYQY